MIKFNKTVGISGKIKNISTNGDTFIDSETGEEINLALILNNVYGEFQFDISVTQKSDEEITANE